MTRKYELKRRAERQVETRKRIVDATIELHETVGPIGATITAIAARAGVSRLTVYRHFPDEVSLLTACTSTYNIDHPPPDPSTWAGIADPSLRLTTALAQLYRYYADNERILSSGADAMPTHPALAEAMAPFFHGMELLRQLLATGWGVDAGPGSLLSGAIGHAVALPTWRSLRQQQGLTNPQAVTLMTAMVTSARDAQLREEPLTRR